MLDDAYFFKIFYKISLQGRVIFILLPKFFELFNCKIIKYAIT